MKSFIKQFLQKLLGMKMYLYVFSNYIIYTLPFNKREKDFLHFIKLIKGDGLIMDIGANIGIMTYHLSKKKPNSKILAFEPVPVNLDALRKIVATKHLNNVEILPFALGNENTEGQIIMPEIGQVKMQGLSHIVHESIKDLNEGKKFKTEIRKIDNLDCINNSKEKLIAIKMDVENFESFVLEGAIATLTKHKPLIYTELWENENREKCIDILTGIGYKIMIKEKGQLIKFDPLKHKTQNFFFLFN